MTRDNVTNKKTCFIVTPIGGETDPIRRHIDGIIDTVIEPLVNEKGYELIVAHRITSPGSINKQVISGIYDANLVIANLTNLNPNVMYELAFAHSIGKPTISIAESGTTKLPFDISTERTIFYKNDFMGVIELRNDISSIIDSIEENPNNEDIDNPIYTWLDKSIYENKLVKSIEEKEIGDNYGETDLFRHILWKIDNLESKIVSKDKVNEGNNFKTLPKIINFVLPDELIISSAKNIERFINEVEELSAEQMHIELVDIEMNATMPVAKFKYDKLLRNEAIGIVTDLIDTALRNLNGMQTA